MNQQIYDLIKAKLQNQKKALIEQLASLTQDKSFDKDKIQAKWQEVGDKEEDNAVEVASYQDNMSLERNLETNLEKIEKALKKMDEGKYGICERCGQPIEENRLEAYPEAALCLKCTSRIK